MLQTMRHWAQSWVFKGLMLMLVISFGIWGIGDIFHGNPSQRTVAKVGGISITAQQLNHEFDLDLIQGRQVFGPSLTAQQAKQMGFIDKALDTMIDRALLDQKAHSLGIDISPQALLNKIAALPQFRDKDGRFNLPLFRQLMAQEHLNEHDFMEQGRQDMIRRQLMDVLDDPNKPVDFVINSLIKARGQKRFFDIVEIDENMLNDIPSPDDKTLHAFWQNNQQLFMSPEYRSGTIAVLSADNISKGIQISDDDLKKEYQKRSDDLIKPERRDIVQVLVQDEEQAKKIAEAAKESNDLQATAKSLGHEAIPLNQVDRKTLLPELAPAVFALQNGQISAPLKSSLGWHIVQIKKITAGGKISFDEAKDDLRESLKKDRAADAVTQLVNNMDDDLAAGHSLEDIADSLKLKLVKIPLVDVNGKMANGKEPSDFANKDDVLKAMYSQNSGETSSIMEDKQSDYYVVRTDDISPSAVKPFDKAKTEIASEWKKYEQIKHAETEAQDIAKAIREGKSLSSFTGSGISARVSKAISLLANEDPTVPESIIPQMMKIKKGEVITASVPNKQFVIRLNKTAEINVGDDKAARIKLESELPHDVSDEIVEQYLQYLRQIYPVKIYQDVLDTIQPQNS